MAEKLYEVISDKYVGKHKIYVKGNIIPEEEIFGDKTVALNGQKDAVKKRGGEVAKGADGKPLKLRDVEPKLKAFVETKKAGK